MLVFSCPAVFIFVVQVFHSCFFFCFFGCVGMYVSLCDVFFDCFVCVCSNVWGGHLRGCKALKKVFVERVDLALLHF